MTEDLTGKKFGHLLVLGRSKNKQAPDKHSRWLCRCDCGAIKEVIGTNLKRGTSKSCGCMQKDLLSARVKTHGGWANHEKLYEVWHGIKKRCDCVNDEHYKYYGARGVSLCDEWRDYPTFRSWALNNGYRPGLSIDRIDVDGDYTPLNCRWADAKTQQNNRRSCKLITYNGETHTLKEWSELRKINYQTLYQRYRLGWSTPRMLGYAEN